MPLATLDRLSARPEEQLPAVSLVAAVCLRCRMSVLVVRVGEERFPVQLEISTSTVVADTGRVFEGHPLHDIAACEVRVASNFFEIQRRERVMAERLSQ